MNHYLLIKREGVDSSGRPLSALESATALLKVGMWPLWEHTRNRRAINTGNRVAVYLSGEGGSRVIATATVEKVGPWDRATASSYPLTLDGTPFAVLHLSEVLYLKKPVEVRASLDRLSFVKHGARKWGVAFMGGARAMNASDFMALTCD